MLWILFTILAVLGAAVYYKKVICGDQVDVADVKKRSEEKSQRNVKSPSVKAPKVKSPNVKAPSVKSPNVKAPSVKSPSVKAPMQDARTAVEPTPSERVQGHVKVDKPTTPDPIDDQVSNSPSNDVMTAKEPSIVVELPEEVAAAKMKEALDSTQVLDLTPEASKGQEQKAAEPTLRASMDTQSDGLPTKDVKTAVDPTPSDVKQSQLNNDVKTEPTASDVQSADTSTARDPIASEIKQVAEIMDAAASIVPLNSQMSMQSEVKQPAKESPSEVNGSEPSDKTSSSGQTASQPTSQLATDPATDKKKKKHKKKAKKHSDGKTDNKDGVEKKKSRSKESKSEDKSKSENKSKEETQPAAVVEN